MIFKQINKPTGPNISFTLKYLKFIIQNIGHTHTQGYMEVDQILNVNYSHLECSRYKVCNDITSIVQKKKEGL